MPHAEPGLAVPVDLGNDRRPADGIEEGQAHGRDDNVAVGIARRCGLQDGPNAPLVGFPENEVSQTGLSRPLAVRPSWSTPAAP